MDHTLTCQTSPSKDRSPTKLVTYCSYVFVPRLCFNHGKEEDSAYISSLAHRQCRDNATEYPMINSAIELSNLTNNWHHSQCSSTTQLQHDSHSAVQMCRISVSPQKISFISVLPSPSLQIFVRQNLHSLHRFIPFEAISLIVSDSFSTEVKL